MAVDQTADRIQGKVRIDSGSAKSEQRRKMMHLSWFRTLYDHGKGGSLLRIDQMLLHGRYRQKCRNRHMVFIHSPVGEDQNVGTVLIGPVCLQIETMNRLFQRGIFIIGDGNNRHLKARYMHGLDL